MIRSGVLAVIILLLGSFLFSGTSSAKVTGSCVNCHTMHNSQNAASMDKGNADPIGVGGSECLNCHASARPNLLAMDCLGCHANSGTANIDVTTGAPQIWHEYGDLAAGNFKYMNGIDGGDEYGHNVHGFGAGINIPDILHLDKETFTDIIPPGYDSGYDPSALGFDSDHNATEYGMMCAGANGCHGNRDKLGVAEAMKGTHHADDSMLKFPPNGTINEGLQGGYTGGGDATGNVGKSYRFLLNVHGGEDPDWQKTKSTTDHNEYKGEAISTRTTQTWTDIQSISSFCAECHGLFHKSGVTGIGDTGTSPWLRHPTDVVMSSTGEFSGYLYDVDTPIARVTIPASSTDDVTDRVVMCLSCHRPHASPYKDALRWDYNTSTPLPNGTGCFACHTYKD